jgi:hypothetical protein
MEPLDIRALLHPAEHSRLLIADRPERRGTAGRQRVGPAGPYRRRGVVLLLLRREPVIPAGTTVDVIEIDGATALVDPGSKS